MVAQAAPEKENPWVPQVEIKNKHFRYADLVLFGEKRRKTHKTEAKKVEEKVTLKEGKAALDELMVELRKLFKTRKERKHR